MQHVRLMPPTLLRRYSIGPRKRVTASPYVQDGCLFQWKKSRIVGAATRSPLSRLHGEIAGVANHPPRFFFPIPLLVARLRRSCDKGIEASACYLLPNNTFLFPAYLLFLRQNFRKLLYIFFLFFDLDSCTFFSSRLCNI